MSIFNLTQHKATPEQIAQGVVDCPDRWAGELRELLTFNELPTASEIHERAMEIAALAEMVMEGIPGCTSAMIGGAPFLMGPLEAELTKLDILPLYAFSIRESVEQEQADGSVRKVNVFRHVGFVDTWRGL